MQLTQLYKDFTESEKSGGIILIICTILSLIAANSFFQHSYIHFWHNSFAGQSLEYWINDGLMTIFFLLIGLELEREFYIGELSDLKNAALPVFGALGGMLMPAGIFLIMNYGTSTQAGAGIPMATDIAFAIGILSLLGNKVPASLKVFLTALAVIDDLGAILVISIFYSSGLSFLNLAIALAIFGCLLQFNRLKIHNLLIYIVGGIFMWIFFSRSGIHPTITGVLLAFAIPFGNGDSDSPSYKLQHYLHKPVAFFILPVFALANTAIIVDSKIIGDGINPNSLGIITGLLIGKPFGIWLFSFLAATIGWCSLPKELKWKQIIGVGFLGGIGFTMSIFIVLLAFDNQDLIAQSKIAVLAGSVISALMGLLFLKLVLPKPTE